MVSSGNFGGNHDLYRLWNCSSIRRFGGAHDAPEWCSRWAGITAHDRPEWVLTMRRNTQNARKDLSLKLDLYKSEAIENPQNASARINLADAYYGLAMYAEAELEYMKTVELEPNKWRYHGQLCVNYSEWHKLEKAVACYQEATRKDPNHVYYFSLGHLYERLGKSDEAIASYKQSLEKKPDFGVALYQLAGVYVGKRELRHAIEPLRKLLAEEPNHEQGNFTLGQVYARLGDNIAAMQQYYTLQNLNPRLAANLLQQISK